MASFDDSVNSQLSILLVDDDRMVREVTAGMLADAGHQVHSAVDGVAALDFLTEHGPVDVLITDIGMPNMDGLTLADHVRTRWPGLHVLLVSGRAQPPGTQAFMSKPFGWHDLTHAVAALVNKPG